MPSTTTISDQKQETSSGNSSKSSSQTNGINSCDRQIGLENTSDKLSFSDDSAGYGNLNGCLVDNDADTTILSDTSTIQGDSATAAYANKCAELERMVTGLKNKLITKEKELTELQLSQLHTDYTIDRLRSQLSKLQKENAELKSVVMKSNNNNHIRVNL